MPINSPQRSGAICRRVDEARASLSGYRWVALLLVVVLGGVAVWFSDGSVLTGVLLIGIIMLVTWFAAALVWAGTVRWRTSIAGLTASIVATVVLFVGLLAGVSELLAPYRDPASVSSLPSIPAPWPLPASLAVLFIGLFLWGGRRSASR